MTTTTTRATHCKRCGVAIEQPKGSGRPRQYCSTVCRSEADRARFVKVPVETWRVVLALAVLALADQVSRTSSVTSDSYGAADNDNERKG